MWNYKELNFLLYNPSNNKESNFLQNIVQTHIYNSDNKAKEIKEISKLIKNFYKDNYEHKYSNILIYVYENNDDILDYTREILKYIVNMFCEEKNKKFLQDNQISLDSFNKEYRIKLNKLLDNLESESARMRGIKKQEYLLYENIKNIKKKLKKT